MKKKKLPPNPSLLKNISNPKVNKNPLKKAEPIKNYSRKSNPDQWRISRSSSKNLFTYNKTKKSTILQTLKKTRINSSQDQTQAPNSVQKKRAVRN